MKIDLVKPIDLVVQGDTIFVDNRKKSLFGYSLQDS